MSGLQYSSALEYSLLMRALTTVLQCRCMCGHFSGCQGRAKANPDNLITQVYTASGVVLCPWPCLGPMLLWDVGLCGWTKGGSWLDCGPQTSAWECTHTCFFPAAMDCVS